MKKNILFFILFLTVLIVPITNVTHGQGQLELPHQASDQAVVSLGQARDPQSGQLVEGYAIIHRRNQTAKPNGAPNKGTGCYGFIASGAKWKTVENWLVNGQNNQGLAEGFIFSNLDGDIAKWEDAADGTVGDGASINILGTGSQTTANLVADLTTPDGANEVYFGEINNSGAIAVTVVWGIFGGPPSGRELVEWDQIYDQVDYNWSATGEAGKMDFENIATHELGHSFGLDDLYTAGCAQETMFGYSDYGETNKRDLNLGDILGISKLY